LAQSMSIQNRVILARFVASKNGYLIFRPLNLELNIEGSITVSHVDWWGPKKMDPGALAKLVFLKQTDKGWRARHADVLNTLDYLLFEEVLGEHFQKLRAQQQQLGISRQDHPKEG